MKRPKTPKGWYSDDVHWHIRGKKKAIAYSTVGASDLITEIAEDGCTIEELKNKIIYDVEAQKVLDEYIKRGLGKEIAKDWFGKW